MEESSNQDTILIFGITIFLSVGLTTFGYYLSLFSVGLQLGVIWDTEPLFFKLIQKALYEVPFIFEVSVDQETRAPYFYNKVS